MIKFVKDIWIDIRQLFVTIIGGFLVKMLIFTLSFIAQFIIEERGVMKWITLFDDIISALAFYTFSIIGLYNFAVSAIYKSIEHKDAHNANMERNRKKLLVESMDELPGSTGEIMEEKAEDIGQFNPSEEV